MADNEEWTKPLARQLGGCTAPPVDSAIAVAEL
jgi:hypothetical protein